MAHKQKIKNNIIKQHNNFATNTTKIINSILQKQTNSVVFNNIIHSKKVTTELQEIKKEIKKHFEEWTKSNSINNNTEKNKTVQNIDIEPEYFQEQTTFLEKEMQKNNMVINTETLPLKKRNIDNFTENMILEETIADL
ncbi:5335_t:CDS:2 [Cetraspora pellucida]|uniref:5335_t:CDS:1 n=1 Tax=Cetraspora pellucida TaxID=1433469 RepID=A0A9N9BXS7_9GLOM|nr:5335_t:CDS:2 [Cetraspora pellucida]